MTASHADDKIAGYIFCAVAIASFRRGSFFGGLSITETPVMATYATQT